MVSISEVLAAAVQMASRGGAENVTKVDSGSSKGSKFYRALGSNQDIVIHRRGATQNFDVSQLSERSRAQVEEKAEQTSTVLEGAD